MHVLSRSASLGPVPSPVCSSSAGFPFQYPAPAAHPGQSPTLPLPYQRPRRAGGLHPPGAALNQEVLSDHLHLGVASKPSPSSVLLNFFVTAPSRPLEELADAVRGDCVPSPGSLLCRAFFSGIWDPQILAAFTVLEMIFVCPAQRACCKL